MEKTAIPKILQRDVCRAAASVTDEHGMPWSILLDLVVAEDHGLYFAAAKGTVLHTSLQANPHLAVSIIADQGPTDFQAVSIRGTVKNTGSKHLDELFDKNPGLQKMYPKPKSRRTLEVFCIYRGEGEYLELKEGILNRKRFSFGGEEVKKRGYQINETRCIGCQGCRSICPVSCISNTFPRAIDQNRCIQCGNCFQICLRKAVEKIG